MKKSASQLRFFEFLKQCEASSKTFTIDDAAKSTGLSEASVKTYLSKKMKDRWVFATEGGHFEVRRFSAIPLNEFLRVMTQKSRPMFANLAEFRDQIEELCHQGKAQEFDVRTVLRVLSEKF